MKFGKKLMSLLTTLVMCLGLLPLGAAAEGGMASPSTRAVEVDGSPVYFQMYAVTDANGGVTNYVRVRDLAKALEGSGAPFDVDWNGAILLKSHTPYAHADGSELSSPFTGDQPYEKSPADIYVDGARTAMDAILLSDSNGGGFTYFRLRDLGAALDFKVDWTPERGAFIETAASDVDIFWKFIGGELGARTLDSSYYDLSYVCADFDMSTYQPIFTLANRSSLYISELTDEVKYGGDNYIPNARRSCAILQTISGKSVLAVRFSGLDIYYQDDDSFAVFIFAVRNGALELTYAQDSWARSSMALNSDLTMCGSGSAGAGDHPYQAGFINGDGLYQSLYDGRLTGDMWVDSYAEYELGIDMGDSSWCGGMELNVAETPYGTYFCATAGSGTNRTKFNSFVKQLTNRGFTRVYDMSSTLDSVCAQAGVPNPSTTSEKPIYWTEF